MKNTYTVAEWNAERYGTKRKKSKFRNVLTRGFDSKKEAQRFDQLMLLMKAGEISALLSQVRFNMVVKGVRICAYVADFTYMEKGKLVVEDVKGVRTPVYRLKKKLMLAVYGIEIKET